MLTAILLDSAKKNKLIIVEGGICRFSRKKDYIKITDILSIKPGAGFILLERIKEMNPSKIIASCPDGWESNGWYIRHGFTLKSQTLSRTGKPLNNYELVVETELF